MPEEEPTLVEPFHRRADVEDTPHSSISRTNGQRRDGLLPAEGGRALRGAPCVPPMRHRSSVFEAKNAPPDGSRGGGSGRWMADHIQDLTPRSTPTTFTPKPYPHQRPRAPGYLARVRALLPAGGNRAGSARGSSSGSGRSSASGGSGSSSSSGGDAKGGGTTASGSGGSGGGGGRCGGRASVAPLPSAQHEVAPDNSFVLRHSRRYSAGQLARGQPSSPPNSPAALSLRQATLHRLAPRRLKDSTFLVELFSASDLKRVILPFGRFRASWDLLILLLVVYTALSLPIVLAYPDADATFDALRDLELAMDFLFMIDM